MLHIDWWNKLSRCQWIFHAASLKQTWLQEKRFIATGVMFIYVLVRFKSYAPDVRIVYTGRLAAAVESSSQRAVPAKTMLVHALAMCWVTCIAHRPVSTFQPSVRESVQRVRIRLDKASPWGYLLTQTHVGAWGEHERRTWRCQWLSVTTKNKLINNVYPTAAIRIQGVSADVPSGSPQLNSLALVRWLSRFEQ